MLYRCGKILCEYEYVVYCIKMFFENQCITVCLFVCVCVCVCDSEGISAYQLSVNKWRHLTNICECEISCYFIIEAVESTVVLNRAPL